MVKLERGDCCWEDLIRNTYNILEWMNFDNKEGSKIKCGSDMPGGRYHVSIHVSVMLDSTNERDPRGCHMEMRWKI
jgi:hypothetical protein